MYLPVCLPAYLFLSAGVFTRAFARVSADILA
jgi:hypothetical protein